MNKLILLIIFTGLYFVSNICKAQSPGLIVQPTTIGGSTFLNPNGDKYVSQTAAGFTSSDVSQSEIPYKIIPRIVNEPVGDNNGGSNGGPTDFVPGADSSGFYAYYDGTNIMFRFRVGSKTHGSKGFSILLDTDLKFGNSGFYADPNYIPPTNSRSGNPGFELEILYAQNRGVQILNVDGTVNGTVMASYSENTHSQASVALSTTSGNADYFIDFGVPASALGIGTQYVRLIATTSSSAASALSNNASDVWGVNDIPTKGMLKNWIDLISMQCGVGISAFSANGPGICICTPAPVVNGPLNPGTNVAVTGTWNRLSDIYSSQANLTLYKNNVAVATILTTTGATWSITVPTLVPGDTLYAKAQSPPESMCLESNRVIVACNSSVPLPSIICASEKGMQGTIPLNATVSIYELRYDNGGTLITPSLISSTGMVYTDGANRTFSYWGSNSQTGSPCSGGANQLLNVNYMVIVNLAGCASQPLYMCINTNNWNQPSLHPTMVLSSPIYANQTSVSGSGGTATGTDRMYRLFRNGIYTSGVMSNTGSFSFTGLTLKAGDQLLVHETRTATQCATLSSTYTVQCAPTPAVNIFSDNGEILWNETSISGYSVIPGATVTVYRGLPGSGVSVGTSIVDAGNTWSVTGLTLTAGQTYYATQATENCSSSPSSTVTVVQPTSPCPSITGTYTESATQINGTLSSAYTGTLKLYIDSILVKTVNVSSATTWSVPVNSDLVDFTDKLSPGQKIHFTTQSPSAMESPNCASTTILCDVPPTPSASPTSVTINQGQTATFDVSSTSNRALYSLVDNSNSNYASSSYGNNSTLSFTSNPFNTPGTYNLKVAADNISAPECRTTTDVTVTVNSMVLPVKFINFSAKENANRVLLTWNVTNESNVKYYQVERSTDCSSNFNPIGKVNYQSTGNTTNTYHFTDNSFSGNACYRIVQVNMDGKITYSNVIPVTSVKKSYLHVNPNPARNNATLFIPSESDRVVTIELLNMNGKKMQTTKVKLHAGNNAIALYNLNYGKGTYVIKVYDFTSFQHIKLVLQ